AIRTGPRGAAHAQSEGRGPVSHFHDRSANHISRHGAFRRHGFAHRRVRGEARGIPSEGDALPRDRGRARPPEAEGQSLRGAHRRARAGPRDRREPPGARGSVRRDARGLRGRLSPARGRHREAARRGEAPRRRPWRQCSAMTMSKSNRASVPYLPKHDAGLRSANDEDDPYRAAAKPPEPTTCPQCHATFNEGRWSWDKPPEDSYEQLCPACQRIHDHFPAGYVVVKGDFLKDHRDEILHLIENHAKTEKA